MLYDQFLKRFEKLNEIVELIDRKLNGRCIIDVNTPVPTDSTICIRFRYESSAHGGKNNLLVIKDHDDEFICEFGKLHNDMSDKIVNYFMRDKIRMADIWDFEKSSFDIFNIDKSELETVIENVNKVIDVWEMGIKIREKMQKQLEINIGKFNFKPDEN